MSTGLFHLWSGQDSRVLLQILNLKQSLSFGFFVPENFLTLFKKYPTRALIGNKKIIHTISSDLKTQRFFEITG
jgi:hypothetical protein